MHLPSSTLFFEQIKHLRELIPPQLVDAVDRARTTVPTAAVVIALPAIYIVAKYAAAQIRNRRSRHYLAIVDPKTGMRSAVPGPPTSLMQILTVGQVPEMLAAPSIVAHQSQMMAQYGPAARTIYLMGAPSLTLSDPKLLHTMMAVKSYDFSVTEEARAAFTLATGPRGMLVIEGDVHKAHRRLINPIFNLKVLKSLLPVMQSTFSELEQVIRSSKGATIDFHSLSVNVTLNVIGRTALDTDFDALSNRAHAINWAYSRIVAAFSFDLFHTLWRAVPGFRYLPLPGNIALVKARKIVFGRVSDIMSSKMDGHSLHAAPVKASDRPSLVAALFDELSKNPDSATFTFEDVQNELLTFLAAGHETSSNLFSMIMYYLARQPEIQAKLLRELDGVDPEEYGQCTYLNWVVHEGLRMHSPAYTTGRKSKYDTTLPLSDGRSLQVPKNTMIFVPIQSIHRSTAIYGDDANTFRPERWANLRVATTVADIPSEEEQVATGIKTLHPYQFFPFNAGPRACIGRQFALMEIRLFVASLVHAFQVEIPSDSPLAAAEPEIKYGVTASPVALPLRFVARA
ncbi:cytochrome P450 [Blastocladiella britannica]|nr:cytochrome P450 [Blastocladiella britannica]